MQAVARWPRWRGRLAIREWDPEDTSYGEVPVVVDGRFSVDPVNVKTLRAALEQADAEPPPAQPPSA